VRVDHRGMSVVGAISALACGAVLRVPLAGASRIARITPSQSARAGLQPPADLARSASVARRKPRRHERRWNLQTYGPTVAVSGGTIAPTVSHIPTATTHICRGLVRFRDDPYHVVTWDGVFSRSVPCRYGRAALLAAIEWKGASLDLRGDCPRATRRSLKLACEYRLPRPTGWTCDLNAVSLTCWRHATRLTAYHVAPTVEVTVSRRWSPGPYSLPTGVTIPALQLGVLQYGTGLTGLAYLVIGKASSCGPSAGAAEARMESDQPGNRLFFAGSLPLRYLTYWLPLPPPGRYLICSFMQRGPRAQIATTAAETTFSVGDGFDPPLG
jgi:hypothetical protein